MKKTLVCLLALFLICTFSLSALAASEETYIYEIGNVTVIFDDTNTLDPASRAAVAQKLVNGDNNVATYGFLCALLNHDYEETGVTTITHCAQPEQPRCLEEYFIVQVCSRCEDTIVERIGYGYITCCPNDA